MLAADGGGGLFQAHFTDHGGDVMSVSILPAVDKNVFVSGSCDSLAKVRHRSFDLSIVFSYMVI